MGPIYCVLFTYLIFLLLVCLDAEQILDKQNDDFDFDGLPGVTYEFKIEVYSGREQCFYQKIANGATLHLSFEVLRGSDRLVDVLIWNPNRNILDSKYSVSQGLFEKVLSVEGIYTICIDNVASKSMFGSKLVYFYLGTYLMADWDKYLQEIEGVTSTVSNFTRTVSSVQNSIEEVKIHQAYTRMNLVKDFYLIIGNNDYVKWWSIFQICIVICTSGFQVFCLRRLFRVPNISGKSKPRA
ncbi:transmembrane emp24 domain-containing protein 6-like [Mytilus galloprovincialis]|uniref:transmembrane emp24 domain-containing protein 6-like n=1 Tax=Mytilus galloprovincialis TaxID=29158 RepID=UPI003F7C9C45